MERAENTNSKRNLLEIYRNMTLCKSIAQMFILHNPTIIANEEIII